MLRSLILALGALALAGGGPATAPAAPAFDHSAFDEILRAAVRDEGVDYRLVRERFTARLDGYLERLAVANPGALPRDERLALYINLYNATMIRAVVERYRPGYSPAEEDFAVFKLPLVRVGGERMSLDDLEHRVVRPEFGEPRVHVALVCAARSCPPLLGRAWTGRDLERLLEQGMRRFVNDPRRNRLDVAARRLELSRIFEWYAEDFGGRQALAAYVGRYTGRDVAGFEIGFLPYSWELNDVSVAQPG